MYFIAAFLAKLNVNTGISKTINIKRLIRLSKQFKTNNGRQWLRNFKINGKTLKHETNGLDIRFIGFIEENHEIPEFVKKKLTGVCVVTGSSEVEIDHKNGRYTKKDLDFADYQLLSKSVNLQKRGICKKCKETNCRPHIEGYDFDYLIGGEKYVQNSCSNCKSCYWGNVRLHNKLSPLKVALMKVATSDEYEFILFDLIEMFEQIENATYHETNNIPEILKEFKQKEIRRIDSIKKNTSEEEGEEIDNIVREHMYKIWNISLNSYEILK